MKVLTKIEMQGFVCLCHLLLGLFVPSYRQHITSIMLPITVSLSSHFKASGFSSISICTHFNRVHYHLLPMEQLCLLANLFSCMFSYCPPGVSHGSTMKQWVLPLTVIPALYWCSETPAPHRAAPHWSVGALRCQQPLHVLCRDE